LRMSRNRGYSIVATSESGHFGVLIGEPSPADHGTTGRHHAGLRGRKP
jgi:hypothetical protein